jgi:hypothetical protein
LDGVGQRGDVLLGQPVVEHEPGRLAGAAVLIEHRVHAGERAGDRLGQRRVDLGQRRLEICERLLGALDVGLDVEQVDVRVALLLAGDLAPGHLVEQFDRAVRELGRLVGQAVDQPGELDRIGQQPVAERREPGGALRLEQALLDAVEAGPLGCRHVALARIDRRVERHGALSERLGNRLDPFVERARRRVRDLRRGEVTLAQRGRERLDRLDEQPGLAADVHAVVLGALDEQRARAGIAGGRGRACHPERRPRGLRAGAVQRVRAGLDAQRERSREAGRDVLLLPDNALPDEQFDLADAGRVLVRDPDGQAARAVAVPIGPAAVRRGDRDHGGVRIAASAGDDGRHSLRVVAARGESDARESGQPGDGGMTGPLAHWSGSLFNKVRAA